MLRPAERASKIEYAEIIKINNSDINLTPMIVVKPEHFGNEFRVGERIAELHANTTNAKDAIKMADAFIQKLPEIMRTYRIVGFYGDTSNLAIIKLLERRLGFRSMEVSKLQALKISRAYSKLVRRKGFPSKYQKMPVKRLVLRVDNIESELKAQK